MMAKVKISFFCQNCGTQYSKWQGQCNSCKQWNTIVEELVQKETTPQWKTQTSTKQRVTKYLPLHEISSEKEIRLDSGDKELNNVLGGGIVPGSVTPLCGGR